MNVKLKRRMTVAEQKAFDQEIDRQIVENLERVRVDLETMILWNLHEQFGFGEVRLKRFHDSFFPLLKKLEDHYEMHDDRAQVWLCRHKLRSAGIDVDKLCASNPMLKIESAEGENTYAKK